MAQVVMRLLVLLATVSLGGCASVSFRLDATADRTNPILLTPDTRGEHGGPVSISLPEFALVSEHSLELSIDFPSAASATVTLEKTFFGGLEARIPGPTYAALASASNPEDALFKALKEKAQKLRVRQGPNTLAAERLAISLAARLPRSTSKTWSDLYAYDPALRSLSLMPGMRLRLEGVIPVTADADEKKRLEKSHGSIAAPSYLYLSPWDDNANGSITLSPALRGLGVDSSDKICEGGKSEECQPEPKPWYHAVGLSSLIEQKWRYWTLVYPKDLGPARGSDGALQFVHEELIPRDGAPAVLLVAATNVADMAAFIAAAKAVEQAKAVPQSQKSKKTSIDCENTPTRCFVLRYRVLPVPEILVTVQGVQRWIEIGTTVGMVLAPHEPMRAPRTLAGQHLSAIEEWRNADTRLSVRRLDVHRLYRGNRHAIEVQPGSPAASIRNVVLQPGDEIKWSN